MRRALACAGALLAAATPAGADTLSDVLEPAALRQLFGSGPE